MIQKKFPNDILVFRDKHFCQIWQIWQIFKWISTYDEVYTI